MPRNKIHSGTKKRFRITGSGKLMRGTTDKRHLLERKSSHRTCRLSQDRVMAPSDMERVKKLLGK